MTTIYVSDKNKLQSYYENNDITIYHGDCLEILPKLNFFVNATITDIPYGDINHIKRLHERAKYKDGPIRNLHKGKADIVNFDLEKLLGLLDSITLNWIYIFAGDKTGNVRSYFSNRDCMTRIGVWEKTNPTPLHGQYIWLSAIEICAIARKHKSKFNLFCKNPIWQHSIPKKHISSNTKTN